ncbi:hypothetical protein [Pseudomonas iridis]|uniref:hypothetical protein n=1 Tax=Pseudomonas iridis TaxID=2710587 RepID=UPI001B341276|nr:hypothetical protein [Pseudomonas iridis]MBP5971072.1 hypothetical protein [Pseudomonas iridis]
MVDELFQIATGWLGWSPREAWRTPVVEIVMAWESKRQFLSDTNPFGGGGGDSPPSKQAVAKEARMGFRVAAMSRPKATPE